MRLDYEQVIGLCKTNNEARLRYEDFCTGVNETLSDPAVTHPYPKRLALEVMQDFIEAGNRLDQLKKALFYGKNLEGVIAEHIAYYDYRKSILPIDEWDIEDNRMMHGILGMATEDVELVEALHDSISGNKELDTVNLLEELGDSEFYKAVIFSALLNKDFDKKLKHVWATVLLKLNLRYENKKFSSENAIKRNLRAERELLENRAS